MPRKVHRRADQPRHRRHADADHGGRRRSTAPASAAQIAGYTVAGKTGTAKKLVNGSYRGHSDYNVSFVGFVPSRKPVFTIVVVVDSPHQRARRTAASSPRRSSRGSPTRRCGTTACRRRSTRPSRCVRSRPSETSEQPASGPSTPAADRAARRIAGRPTATVFPDLTGMSARDALRVLAQLGLTARLQGTGVVVAAVPAGRRRRSNPRSTVVLWLEPRDARHRRARRSHDRRRTPAARSTGCRDWRDLRCPAAVRSTRPCTGVTHDSRAGRAGRGVRGAARAEGRRRGLRAAGDRRGRRRRSWPRRRRATDVSVPWIVVGDARLALALAGRRVLRAPEPRDAGGRHHRHQRQDDDGLSGQRDSRGRRHPAAA